MDLDAQQNTAAQAREPAVFKDGRRLQWSRRPTGRNATVSHEMEENKIETAYHEAGHAVMGCLLERLPISVSIVADVKGAVGKTEFEQDAPPGGFRHFDGSERKKKYIRTLVLIEVAGTIPYDIEFPGRAHDQGDAHDDYTTIGQRNSSGKASTSKMTGTATWLPQDKTRRGGSHWETHSKQRGGRPGSSV
ncbi:hypothetical protein ABIB85_007587 [Bradyrhizobium sp. JR1.5]|uniref:hypothetical protein n=1 Tax=unclassified Bradyrhizobium TaxID=2631580 RepID=UPI0033999FFB